MQAVILAAGLGTRLSPVTATRSKAMVPVLGRPLVERAMLPLVANGVKDFVIVAAPDDREIVHHFEQLSALGITVRVATQMERLGTANALEAASHLISGPFILSACDSLIDASHVRSMLAAAEAGADAVLSLLDVDPEMVSRSAAVAMDGDAVRQIVEKPRPEEAPSFTISLPHYVFAPRFLDLLHGVPVSARGEYEIQDAVQRLIYDGARVVGVRATARLQVSTPTDLLAMTCRLLADSSEPKHIYPDLVGRATELVTPLRVDRGVTIGDGCVIGPEVYLETGCRVGDGAEIRRAIVLRGAEVGDGERVRDRIVS
jgi:NDP-sugar pyrophosphorylase family protein